LGNVYELILSRRRRGCDFCAIVVAMFFSQGSWGEEAMKPLELPSNFNPGLSMISRREDTGTFHASRLSAEFAARLVANGTPQDLALAEKVLASVRACQELNPEDPHRGNYRWEFEDATVEDLNAVHFVLIELVPMMIDHEERLSPACQDSVLDSIRFALQEIERIDVGLEYTNIVLKDITNTILGGELLQSEEIVERGRAKLADWFRYTYASGGVFELNSPAYTPLALRVLHVLSTHARDPDTAVLARLAAARMGLSYALRVHPHTGRLSGPYSRAYRSQLLGELGSERSFVEAAVEKRALPAWILGALDATPLPSGIVERFDTHDDAGYTSWLSPSYSIGTASKELDSQANRFIAGQSNVFTMNFVDRSVEQGGMVYTRYLLDDKWLGDYRVTKARSNDSLLPDEGQFFGVQSGSSCLGMYAPRALGAWEAHSAAKLAIIVSRPDSIKEMLVNGEPVDTLPAVVPDRSVVCFDFDQSRLAILLFERTDLGRGAPIRIVKRHGDLVLEMYNYLGPEKTFWELANPGSFYEGQPRCAFYAEASEKSAFPSLARFSEAVSSGAVIDQIGPPRREHHSKKRICKVGYSRDDRAIGLEVDLMQWRLIRRWNEQGDVQYPLLAAAAARQSDAHIVEAAGAVLRKSFGNFWLYGNTRRKEWVVGGFVDSPTQFEFETPSRAFRVKGFRFGTITVTGDDVRVDCNDEASMSS
jgi:hypothetical protein